MLYHTVGRPTNWIILVLHISGLSVASWPKLTPEITAPFATCAAVTVTLCLRAVLDIVNPAGCVNSVGGQPLPAVTGS